MPKVVAGYKEEAKKTILQTAAEVFSEKGYHEATMDDVAEKLGVSKGAVYQYFPSKDVLFQELCGNAAKKVEEMLRTNFTGPTVRDSAERYIDAELDKMTRGQLLFEALAEAPRNPALSRVVRGNYTACSLVLKNFLDGLKDAGELKRDVDTVSAVRFLIALRHGVLVSFVQGLGRQEAKKVWLNGFDSVLAGSIV